ncbi:MAG: hypothetical protein ACRCUT_10250 [Spirochaetota bacterium]
MQSDTVTMVECQRRWDSVLHGKSEIKSAFGAIREGEKSLTEARSANESLKKSCAAAKSTQKQKELDLMEKEALLKKIDEKRFTVSSNREIKALDSENDSAFAEKGLLEEELLRLMDEIAEMEKSCEASESALSEKEVQAVEKAAMMQERISRFEKITAENEKAFNEGLSSLSSQLRSRFGRMVQSADGKGIVALDGETCSSCRCGVPSDVRQNASRPDTVANCPHCGKYIYAPDAFPSAGL